VGKRKKKKSSGFALLFIGLALVVLGLIGVGVGASLEGKKGTVPTIAGSLALIIGLVLCVMNFLSPLLSRSLDFGKEAVQLLRGQNKTVIGEIPYSNIASAELTDFIVISVDDMGVEQEVDRVPVVGITVYKKKDKDTYWPFEAGDRDSFDFYIPNNLNLSLSAIAREIDQRVLRYREQKTRKRSRGD
jgi:hypothetical protein